MQDCEGFSDYPPLTQAYEKWRSTGELGSLPQNVRAPLLLAVPDQYFKSPVRLAYIGQEPLGWGFGNVKTVRDFASVPNAVNELIAGYRNFRFAENCPGNRNSPFWQFFRKLASRLNVQPVWTNLVRFCVENAHQDSMSVLQSEPALRAAILQRQRGLLAAELEQLAPDVCVFVTGPRYDSILDDQFAGVRRHHVFGFGDHQFAKLSHPALPLRSFRLYHPGFLRRSGLEVRAFEALVQEIVY
jgi:hypothetical protein